MLSVIKLILPFFFLFSQLHNAQSAEILVVTSMPSYSHFILPFTIAKELINRGHHITCINPFPQKTKLKNYEDVSIVENIELLKDIRTTLINRDMDLDFLFKMTTMVSNSTLHNKNVVKLMDSNKKFDLIIIEHFFNEAFLALGYKFQAPVVLIGAQASNSLENHMFANPQSISYIPAVSTNLASGMNFWERIKNLFMMTFFNSNIYFKHLPNQKQIFESFVKEVPFEDVLYNVSLLLTNSHPSISHPKPLVPAIVEVGGFHVNPKPLPEDLQKFLDQSQEGVVIFSMGSNLRSADLKPETRIEILKAFGKLKQKVLWKFETDLPDLPKNVKIMDWLPLQDALGHPNVQAFITHGGRLSTIEAVYHGVPLIGVPVFGDQSSNVATAVNDGYAVQLNLNELSEEVLTQALNEILNNPKYRNEAQRRSRLMQDRPMKPLDTAIYWIEHVIRHKGAPHLKTAGLNLTWYQREMIDIFIFLSKVLSTSIFLIYVVVKKVLKCFCKKKVQVKKDKLKKQ